ncbi:MAG: hypothetical protein HRU19_00065 [Pseudobacteriovorax sp.]|nr:hypothetical protein [Pseudobacteriovorax sp.]
MPKNLDYISEMTRKTIDATRSKENQSQKILKETDGLIHKTLNSIASSRENLSMQASEAEPLT